MLLSWVIYCIIPLLFIINDFLARLLHGKSRQLLFISICDLIILLLLFSLRTQTVGTDTIAYYSFFEKCKTYSFESIIKHEVGFEVGFSTFTWIFSNMRLPFSVYLFFCGCLIFIPLLLIFWKLSTNITLSIMLFYCFGMFSFCMSGLRQSMALGIILLGFFFFDPKKNKTFVLFLLFVFLAYLFHNSALICILLPLAYIRIKPTLINMVVKWSIIVVFLLSTQIMYSAFFFTIRLYPMAFITSSSPAPTDSSFPETDFIYLSLLLITDFALERPLFFKGRQLLLEKDACWFDAPSFASQRSVSNTDLTVASNVLLSQALFLAFATSTTTFTRLSFYFAFGFCILVPDFFTAFFSKRISNVVFWLITIACFLFFAFVQLKNNAGGILPYQFI